MNLSSIIKSKKVVVTGSQRSGTTIAAKMIAEDCLLPHYDESFIHVDDVDSFEWMRDNRDAFVLQAPGLCHVAHKLGDDVQVIFMVRNFNDILDSCGRINWWEYNKIELEKYTKRDMGAIDSWEAKWIAWDAVQRDLCGGTDLHYDTLRGHDMWIDREQRREFSPKQTV